MTSMSDAARQYSRTHAERFRHELHDMIRIPSVSADPAHAGDVQRVADWLANHMRSIGINNVQILPTGGHPVVYGEWLEAGPDKPTVLVYGHYDVQPAAMEDGWFTPPFEPIEKDGLIYARGASDDKGQMFIHVKVFESYLKTAGSAPVNLKFFFEGEEEIGSKSASSATPACG
jgi:acetylornithine deacetylase/succinyl-diaminopimelate desuccinylase-like protein